MCRSEGREIESIDGGVDVGVVSHSDEYVTEHVIIF
jgi:hypothetical protein